jgi:hypothetical protein
MESEQGRPKPKVVGSSPIWRKEMIMKAVYLDDFGTIGKPVEMTEEEMNRRNRQLDDLSLEEYGRWVELSKAQED